MAADVAAMAEGTNIGAAHPVDVGGGDIGKTMSDKVTNDMVANAKSVAQKRGRNAKWVEKAIRESVSVTESEALKDNIIDLVAPDLQELLNALDGREIKGKGVLHTRGAPIQFFNEGLSEKVLKIIGDPNIAYILLMIGLAGLYFELAHPGAIFPGVIGAIALILSFYALQTLPVNYAGVLLILLALVLFILETQIAGHGALAVGGIISLILGSVMLFEKNEAGISLSLSVLIPTVATVSTFFVVVAGLVIRSHVSKPRTGLQGIVGEVGIVAQVSASGKEGKIQVHGELWQALFEEPVVAGDRVAVKSASGLVISAKKI
jgi:membrane-bound serine protease (ClpP class)